MKRKLGVLVAIVTTILVFIYLGFSNIFSKNIDKLKADISYPTSNGVIITCNDSSINVDQTTSCTLTGYLTGGASGISGTLETQGGITLSNISYTGWTNYGVEPELTLVYNGVTPSNQFIVATFDITGVIEDNATVKFVGNAVDDNKIIISDSNDSSVEVADAIYNISVVDESTPSESDDNTIRSITVGTQTVDLSTLTITVPYSTNQTTVSVEANEGHATVSGYTNPISLQVGNNPVNISVQAQNGSVREYTLTIVREADNRSSDNTLQSLSVSGTTLSTNFDKNITEYIAIVENDVTSVTITANPSEGHATVSGYTNPISLQVGDNPINIVVTAENESTKTYKLNIQRQQAIDPSKSSDNTLKSLSVVGQTISPEFDASETEYTLSVDKSTTTIKIEAEANEEHATIEGDGQRTLVDGLNSINIVVTAENNSKKIYTIVVTKEASSIVVCNELTLSSTVYKVDNDKLIISNVNKEHNVDTIKNNISTTCGIITVTEEKVILSSDTQTKEYKIERVWIPKTGQNVVKYTLIIVVLVGLIAALLFIKKKMDK